MATKIPHSFEHGTAQNPSDLPEPPRRLLSDNCPLKHETTNAWDGRTANKMRLRFASADHQAQPSVSLVAPVQPPVSGALL